MKLNIKKRDNKYDEIMRLIESEIKDPEPEPEPAPVVVPPSPIPKKRPTVLGNYVNDNMSIESVKEVPEELVTQRSEEQKIDKNKSILTKWQSKVNEMLSALEKFDRNFKEFCVGRFEREYKKDFRVILNKWSTEDIDNKIIEFSWKILEVFKKCEGDNKQTLAVLRILVDRLFAVTDNKPNQIAFHFYTGILENVNKKYPLFKELMIANIFSQNKGIALLAKERKMYKSEVEYYEDRGYKYTTETADNGSKYNQALTYYV